MLVRRKRHDVTPLSQLQVVNWLGKRALCRVARYDKCCPCVWILKSSDSCAGSRSVAARA